MSFSSQTLFLSPQTAHNGERAELDVLTVMGRFGEIVAAEDLRFRVDWFDSAAGQLDITARFEGSDERQHVRLTREHPWVDFSAAARAGGQ